MVLPLQGPLVTGVKVSKKSWRAAGVVKAHHKITRRIKGGRGIGLGELL